MRDGDKDSLVTVAIALAELGFELLATSGRRTRCASRPEVERVRKVTEEGGGPTVVDLIRRGRCNLVVNTPQGSGARTDGYLIREAALVARVPVHHDALRRRGGRARNRERPTRRVACPSRNGSSMRRARLDVRANESVGPYTLLRVARGPIDPGGRDSSSCSRRRAGCCRGR